MRQEHKEAIDESVAEPQRPSKKKLRICETCRHYFVPSQDLIEWTELSNEEFGECRRYPPQMVFCHHEKNMTQACNRLTFFPVVENAYCCGEWKKI